MRCLLPLLALCTVFAADVTPQTGGPDPIPATGPGSKPLRIFLRSGPKSHGPGDHDHPAFLRDWVPLLKERGAKVEGGDIFPTAAQLAEARDALLRVENMVGMGPGGLPSRVARQLIASALSVVLHLQRLSDGSRRVVSISELTGQEGETILMQDLQVFEATGVDAQGRVLGRFRATGVRPQLEPRLRAMGLHLPSNLFVPQ